MEVDIFSESLRQDNIYSAFAGSQPNTVSSVSNTDILNLSTLFGPAPCTTLPNLDEFQPLSEDISYMSQLNSFSLFDGFVEHQPL
jgi:hypothetical protein